MKLYIDSQDKNDVELSHTSYAGDRDADWSAWSTSTGDREAVEERPQEAPVGIESDAETDSLVAQYFGDVRQFALLTRAEEKTLWQHIERLKKREHRALYTSPICLPTLQRLRQEVIEGERLHQNIVAEKPSLEANDTPAYERFEALIVSLQNLEQQIQCTETQHRQRGSDFARTRRSARRLRADLWHQWIDICNALEFQPSVYEILRDALDTALLEQPDHLALRAAHARWRRANSALEEAKAQMLRANLRLVIYVAKRFRNDDVPFLDLIQEGNIGLMRALDKFEPSRGLKFVTYAHWWVRQAIGRAIIEQCRTVRLPSHVVERKNKLRAAETKLWQVHQREPTAEELGVELGWSREEVEALQDTRQVMVRLHEPISEDGQRLAETMEDEQSPEPDVLMEQRELQERVAACLSGLSEREAHILRLRFGLDTDRAHSLREIGEIYGLSRERIRQLEAMALNKLRSAASEATLADFVDVV